MAVPDDLLAHRLLSFAHWKPQHSWTLVSPVSGEIRRLVFEPSVAMNDFSGIAAALLDHVGIGALPPVCRPELIREGKLVEVLPQWRFRVADLSLVHLGNRQIPKVVRAFKAFATAMAPTLFPELPR
jgi:DNA-binding transcriptional LysR family regulator